LLVSSEDIMADLKANSAELEEFGVQFSQSQWFLPPY
jgi:hypothetical protein